MLIICIKCFYFQLAWKADFVLWQCFLCNMVAILLGTGHYLCRGRLGGGRETRREESRLFQITKIGGLNSFIKTFRGGGGQQFDRKLYFPNSQIFILLFVPVIYLSFVTELFTITFFSWWQFFDCSLTLQYGPVYLKDWKGRLDICQSRHYWQHQSTCIASDNMYFSFLSTLSVLFFISHLLPRSLIK